MSNTLMDSLSEKLLQLQCHFTWSPQKDNIDLDDVKVKLQDSISLSVKYQATSYNHLAFVNCLQGNYEEAIQNLKEAEKIRRENHKDEFERRSIITYGNFAWVHYHMGQLAEAQSYLDKLEMICRPLTDGPRYTAMIPEVYGEKGWSLLSSAIDYYEEAKECFEKALEKDPDNTEWIMGYATALFRLESFFGIPENQEMCQAMKQLRRMLEFDPDNSVAMVLLALKLQEFNEEQEAKELVEQALQKTPDLPYVLRYAAKFYRKAGAVDKAIELLKKALERTPNSGFLHHHLGVCYRIKLSLLLENPGSRDPQNVAFHRKATLIRLCKHHFERVFEQRQSFIFAKLDFAAVCLMIGESQRAEEIYNSLLRLDNISLYNKQRLHRHCGSFELHHNMSESNAINHFLEGLKLRHGTKDWKICYNNLREIASNQIVRNANNSQAFGLLGLVHQLAGEKDEAIECFEKALEFDPDNEEYLSARFELCISI